MKILHHQIVLEIVHSSMWKMYYSYKLYEDVGFSCHSIPIRTQQDTKAANTVKPLWKPCKYDIKLADAMQLQYLDITQWKLQDANKQFLFLLIGDRWLWHNPISHLFLIIIWYVLIHSEA